MTDKPHRTAGKKKAPAAVETSSSIDDQVQAFLKAGGQIEQINSGISGQQSLAAKSKAAKEKAAEAKESDEKKSDEKDSGEQV